ncbi:hypothetical protein BpHYR1_016553 [Brachionus plicatilis]|uniref:Uncharacterized protein n=1 Tax=Brachionus plicatilis TaxID=10195 RepID=A0A3M7T2Y6_BRAPC|nr:hypothetical protein BpHYR1_016553 [Brachionus plicatilis]
MTIKIIARIIFRTTTLFFERSLLRKIVGILSKFEIDGAYAVVALVIDGISKTCSCGILQILQSKQKLFTLFHLQNNEFSTVCTFDANCGFNGPTEFFSRVSRTLVFFQCSNRLLEKLLAIIHNQYRYYAYSFYYFNLFIKYTPNIE